MVLNLLSNAVKFTPAGGRVDVELTTRAGRVRLRVADTGAGIDPKFLPYVFERFRQADSSTTRSHGGLGLGLAIVRHLVELHGGTVSARSAGPGQGAEFTVELPVDEAPLPKAGDMFATPPTRRLHGVRVLIVDDQADERELFTTVLEQSGAVVRTAGSVREALALLPEWKPDAVVSDIAMPEQDGYDFLRALRALGQSAGGEVPAVAVTAHARAEDRHRALAAGFQMYISKPIEPDRLIDAVAALASAGRRA